MRIFLFLIIIFAPNILLSGSKGTLESLILTWEASKKGCESDLKSSEIQLHCETMLHASIALEEKGFCLGANELKIYELQYEPKFKEQYDVFEVIVKDKWIPCIYDFLLEDETKSVKFDDEKQNYINWLSPNIDGSYEIDVNKIIYRELIADQKCRGSTDPELTYGGCAVRHEVFQIMENYGICRGDHNNPQHLDDIGGEVVWIFRHKWIPCLYSDLTGEDLVRVDDHSALNAKKLVKKNDLLFEINTLYPYTGLVFDTDNNSSGWVVKGKKNGLWQYFDENNELNASEYYEEGSLISVTNEVMSEMFQAAKVHFSDQCEWERNQGRFHSISFNISEFYAIACISGTYNHSFVYLERKDDGTYKPLSFSYPEIQYEYKEDGDIKSWKMVGMKSVNMLCNPKYDEDQLTISTKCKGRGIGDVASYGLWQLIQEEDEVGIHNQFMLLSFKDDLTLDGKINPIEIINFSSSK